MNLRHISGDMPQAIGVYCLSSSKGEYIGSSNNILQRMKTHDGYLHSGGAAHLLQSVVDAGESFRVSVLQILPEGCTNYELKNAEAEWIKERKPALNSEMGYALPYSDIAVARAKAKLLYSDHKYTRNSAVMSLSMSKGTKDKIKAAAAAAGESANQYILTAVKMRMGDTADKE